MPCPRYRKDLIGSAKWPSCRGAQYWDGRSTHNPHILRQNGKYYLIYMGSTHPFADPTYEQLTLKSPWCTVARANKRVGLAVADSPYGPWKRLDEPILKTKPNTFYSFLTSNPSPISRRRFGDDDIQGATLHERLPALGHEPRNGLCSYHRRPLSSAEQ